jgi:hypothetical protein
MKMGEQHLVPLATQAITILSEVHALTGPTGLVFPSLRSATRPIAQTARNRASADALRTEVLAIWRPGMTAKQVIDRMAA